MDGAPNDNTQFLTLDGDVVQDWTVPSQQQMELAPPQDLPTSPTVALEPRQHRLEAIKMQFRMMERAFLTLEGLCRAEVASIEAEEKKLSLERARAVSRFQDFQRRQEGGVVRLNVGGVRMQVSHSTLVKHPGSLFDVLLSDQFPVACDEYGYIFLDRDPLLFREILHFLRSDDSSSVKLLPVIEQQKVIAEAQYFGVDALVTELRCTRLQWFCESCPSSLLKFGGGAAVVGEVPDPRCFAAAQWVGDGSVYLFGGCTASDVFFDTLYKVTITPCNGLTCCGPSGSVIDVSREVLMGSDLSRGAAGGGAAGIAATDGVVQGRGAGAAGGALGWIDDDHDHVMEYVSGRTSPSSITAAQCRPERFTFSLVRGRRWESTQGLRHESEAMAVEGGAYFTPPPRSGHAMVHVDGHLLLLYGNDKSGHVNDVFAFNLFTQQWMLMACVGDVVEPRSGHSVSVVSSSAAASTGASSQRLWLIGGKQIFPRMRSFGDIFEGTVNFETLTIHWRRVTPQSVLPQGTPMEKRGYHSAVVYQDHLIVLHGGIVRDLYSPDICIYDTRMNVWRTLKPGDPSGYVPCAPRSGHLAVIHNDEMFVYGSYSEEQAHMTLNSFCLQTYKWRRVSTSGRGPSRRAAPAGVLLPLDHSTAMLPRLLIFGGFDIVTRRCYNDIFTITL